MPTLARLGRFLHYPFGTRAFSHPKALLLKWLPFLLIFAILALVSLHFRVFAMDEYTYMNAADAFSRHDASLVLEGESGRFYVFPQIVAWSLPYLKDVEFAGKALNLLFYGVSVFLLYVLARRLCDEQIAYWGALLYASNPFVIFLSTRVLTEPLFLLLLIASIGILERLVRNPNQLNFLIFGAVAAALVFTRFLGLYLFLIAFLFLWKERRMRLLSSSNMIIASGVFLLLLVVFILGTPSSQGTPLERVLDFVQAQVNVRQGDLSLPDKIPSYFLLFPFTLAFLTPWLLPYLKKPRELLSSSLALPSLAVLGVVLSMELYGLFNFRLFRYLVPVIPFLCILAAHSIVRLSDRKPRLPFLKNYDWRQVAQKAVLLNVLLGFVLIVGVYAQYEKHAAYAQAGQFVAANCPSTVFSNVPAVVTHYTKRPASYFTDSAPISENCVLKSAYDAWGFDAFFPKGSYRLLYERQGISVYGRK